MTSGIPGGNFRAPMRVLHYTQEYPPEEGGIETYCASLVRELVARGHEVVVALRDGGDPREPATDAAQPHPVVRLRRYFKPAFLYRAYATGALFRLARRLRPDVLWLGHWFRHAAAATRAVRPLGVPYVITCHGEEVMFDPARPSHSDRRLLRGYRGAARIFANSRSTAERAVAQGLDPAKLALVHCGVEARYFEAPDPARVAELRARLGAGPATP
ncbi:MAG TPA: glycosyltransferase family 4 protein, partial [Planctomycetota bacterium]|nr:glycosyltransferase family 4 protein [Planctomycetota bacterium]